MSLAGYNHDFANAYSAKTNNEITDKLSIITNIATNSEMFFSLLPSGRGEPYGSTIQSSHVAIFFKDMLRLLIQLS